MSEGSTKNCARPNHARKSPSPYPNLATFGSASPMERSRWGPLSPMEEREEHMKVLLAAWGLCPLELPHPFVDDALFLASWVTGKASQLKHSPRKKKPGALSFPEPPHRRVSLKKVGIETSGQAVPSMQIDGTTRRSDRATMAPKSVFGR
jgi:hypothetical protein